MSFDTERGTRRPYGQPLTRTLYDQAVDKMAAAYDQAALGGGC